MNSSPMQQRRAIILGAGIAGLATSIHLAQRGYKVTVLEKNARPGGRCNRFERDGFVFDTGPTLYVMPHLYQSEFDQLGVNTQTALDLQRVDPTYHLYFDDGSQLALTSDLQQLGDQLEAIEPGASAGLQSYLAEGDRHYKLGLEHIVLRHFRRPTDFFNLKNLPLFFKLGALSRHYQHMGAFFDNPRLKASFTFQDMYMGLSPFEAPATFSLMPYSELAHGVYFPQGGMYRIVEALVARAEELGVALHLLSAVTAIETEAGRATGVTLENGDRLTADIIVANADLPYVYGQLLPPDGSLARLERKRYSCSTFSFFWGLNRQIPGLQPHMLFLSDDYKGGFQALNQGGLPEEPSLYIHAPTRLDASLAPAGCDSLISIVPVGHLDANPDQDDWQVLRDNARQAVFERLNSIGIGNVGEQIRFEVCYTPCSWRKRYNLFKGATHGLSHTLTQLAYLRPHNRHKRYRNLYFVGASTHPGTGVPTVLVSARLAAERIEDEWGQASRLPA